MAVEMCALRLELALPHWAEAPAFVTVLRIFLMAAIEGIWEATAAVHGHPPQSHLGQQWHSQHGAC